ncbi:MAG: P1 family peptidase, partial [Thermoplasmata archaeon]
MAARTATLTLVPGVRVGQAEAPGGSSGVTVTLFDAPAPTVIDVRGGASATYDTASLSLDATFGRRWAIFFAGGSLYGLDAARGVRTRILETGGGHRAFQNPIPVVPISGAALFDLPQDMEELPDYLPLGYEAARRASRDAVAVGRFGAGAGATVGKYRGRGHAMRGGVGSAASRERGLGSVGVLVAINAV